VVARAKRPDDTVTIHGRELTLTSPAKVYFPAGPGRAAITKAEVVEYYRRIAVRMLPWVRDRPLVLHRFPDGIGAGGFYHKERPDHFPSWIGAVAVPKAGGVTNHVVVEEPATLVHLANFGCIEFHVWPAPAAHPTQPDDLVIDLDPSRGLDDGGLDDVRLAARLLLELLDAIDVPVHLKSSGSRGLHLHVPLDTSGDRAADNEAVTSLASALVTWVARQDPDRLTVEFRKRDRGDRLYLDVGRNGYAQHVAAPYSLRARPGAPVAVPLAREEAVSARFDPRRITVANLFRRLARLADDPWDDVGRRRIPAGEIARRLGRLDH
jgi:bifunctional non-homologous end joining protein LigD